MKGDDNPQTIYILASQVHVDLQNAGIRISRLIQQCKQMPLSKSFTSQHKASLLNKLEALNQNLKLDIQNMQLIEKTLPKAAKPNLKIVK